MAKFGVPEQPFSTRDVSAPQRTFGNVWRHFWLSQLRKCFWHLANRGQRWCYTPYNARGGPTTKMIQSQTSTMPRARNPGLGLPAQIRFSLQHIQDFVFSVVWVKCSVGCSWMRRRELLAQKKFRPAARMASFCD